MATVLNILTRIAWRNVWRNHRRTLIMLGAIAVGVWSMIWMTAVMRGMVDQMIKDSIENFTGHIQIHAFGFRDDPSIDNSMPPPAETLIAALSNPRIKSWSTRVKVPGVISSERESMGITIVGIDPQAERQLLFLEKDIAKGHNLESPT
ncbi:ABC transporter permease, partial [Kaarinaea lacus]